jgi:hypothetical protein
MFPLANLHFAESVDVVSSQILKNKPISFHISQANQTKGRTQDIIIFNVFIIWHDNLVPFLDA